MHIKDAKMYKSILQEAIDYLQARAKPEIVTKYARYFKEGYDAWGNESVDLHQVTKAIEEKHPDLTLGQIIELGSLLFKHGKYEMSSLAMLLISTRESQYDKTTFTGIKDWFDHGVGNWGHSDYLCAKVTPPFLLKEIITFQDMQSWMKSPSRWTRRAVPVTLLAIRKIKPPQLLLDFIEPLMLDSERVVHQGTGWFLRELWKIHPDPVEALLFKYRNSAARLIIQYATEKMDAEHKARFRKEKQK